MITEHDLREAIAECEGQRNPTSSTCMKLAAFYTIQDRMFPKEKIMASVSEPVFYSGDSAMVEYKSDTEFAQAIADMDFNELLPIIDELMSALKIVSPKLYDGVMRKLSPTY